MIQSSDSRNHFKPNSKQKHTKRWNENSVKGISLSKRIKPQVFILKVTTNITQHILVALVL